MNKLALGDMSKNNQRRLVDSYSSSEDEKDARQKSKSRSREKEIVQTKFNKTQNMAKVIVFY